MRKSKEKLSYNQVEEWIKKQQKNAETRERPLKQFEEDEREAEKQSRKTVIVFGETVTEFIARNFK